MSSTQLYRAVNDSDQDETSDWYEYDPRLASVGVLARAGVSYRPPRFFSLVGVRICAVVLTSSWVSTVKESSADSRADEMHLRSSSLLFSAFS